MRAAGAVSFPAATACRPLDKTVRFRSLSLVLEELDFFLEKRVPQVKFVDRTFNCRREHTLGIWRHIMEHDNGVTNFHLRFPLICWMMRNWSFWGECVRGWCS